MLNTHLKTMKRKTKSQFQDVKPLTDGKRKLVIFSCSYGIEV